MKRSGIEDRRTASRIPLRSIRATVLSEQRLLLCHVERSETSLFSNRGEILRFAQNDGGVRRWLSG
jgi:hypothetical protein